MEKKTALNIEKEQTKKNRNLLLDVVKTSQRRFYFKSTCFSPRYYLYLYIKFCLKMTNNERTRFINESILKSAEMMRNGFLMETVTYSAEENTNADIASQDPVRWSTWANRNPHDALRLWIIWKGNSSDTSKLVRYYKPNLTPCETFPNALGYAIHLGLSRFFFNQREYSTTPTNRSNAQPVSSVGSAPIAPKSDVGPDPIAPVSNVGSGPANKEMLRNEIMQEYQEAVNCGNKQELNNIYQKAKKSGLFTNQELSDLRNAKFHGKRAITNQGYADRQTERGNTERAERNQNRVTRHTDKMNQKLTNATQEE